MTDTVPLTPAGPPAEPISAPPPRKRRRWIVVLIVAVALAGALVAAFFAADGYAKDYARDYVRDRIIEVLGLEPDAEVAVDIRGSVLLQALTGRIGEVEVSVPEVAFGELRGSADVHAEGVPLDSAAAVEVLRIEFTVAEEDLAPLAGNLSGIELESIALDDPEIVVEATLTILGFSFPIGMGLEPSAADGQLVFSPTSVRVGDETYTADELREDPLLGSFVRDLLEQQSLCIAEQLPRALTPTDVEVRDATLVLTFSGDGAALGGDDLTTNGTCPPAGG